MIPSSFVTLHGGHGAEVALLEYLFRVLLHLLAFGGTAILVSRSLDAVDAVRSAFSVTRSGEEHES